jgi:Ca2+-binding EF-hand superfamily protein
VDDPSAEKGDEVSSHQALSEENQAKLKEVFSLLQSDTQDQVRDVDRLEEILESIAKNFPVISKFSWSPSLIWTIIMQR